MSHVRLLESHYSQRLLLLGIAVVMLLLIAIRWAWVPPTFSAKPCGLANNAAWISVDWTSQPVDEAAVTQLAVEASARKLRYLFPFTTYIKVDGSFSPSYAYAADFVSTFRRHNKDTLLLAWIGIPVRNDRRFGVHGWVDLTDQSKRHAIAAFVARLVSDAGFDGVHLNAEHVNNRDPSYLLLLEDVRRTLGGRPILSIASNDWLPGLFDRLPVVGGYKWSDTYFDTVAERVDQIVAMTYDSFMPLPGLYRLWIREQVRGLSRSLWNSDVELLLGLSVSREQTSTHHPRAENLSNGLAGICSAIQNFEESNQRVVGVAIYAAWEADQEDWEVWQTWLR